MWGCLFFKCRERWNISQEKLTICLNCFNIKEVATTYPKKYAEAEKNVEAKYVDISEATVKKMKVKDLKGGLNSRRLFQIGKKAELQDLLIHEIKDKVPIDGVLENTKNNNGIPKYGRPEDGRPKKNNNQLSKKELPNTAHWQPLIPFHTTLEEPINS